MADRPVEDQDHTPAISDGTDHGFHLAGSAGRDPECA